MPLFDKPLDELLEYRPPRTEQGDFDAFWSETLLEVRQHDLAPVFVQVDVGLRTLDVFDVSFAGWNGERIRGWFVVPRERDVLLPCIVEYQGYGVGRRLAYEHLLYASAGYAHLVVDARGHSRGDTGDSHDFASGPHEPGFMTDGILNPRCYYYRRLISDAVRGLEVARCQGEVDPDRVVLAGASQGGGLALAVAGLEPAVAAVMPDVPFLCDIRRGVVLSDRAPYSEVAQFLRKRPDLVEQTFRTLSYVDGMNFAARATAPAIFSVALMDPICPPSTVFAAYQHYQGPKQIRIYEFNEHEGGDAYQAQERLSFLRDLGIAPFVPD